MLVATGPRVIGAVPEAIYGELLTRVR